MVRIWKTAGVLAVVVACMSGAIEARVKAAEAQEAKAPSALVNLNTATAAELEALPGLGPAISARILEYRQKNGGFKKIEELMNVQGIGEKSFLRLKALVTVTAPRTAER